MKRVVYRIFAALIFCVLLSLTSTCLAADGKWTKIADPPIWLSTSVVNGKIYAIGGSEVHGTVEVYDTGFGIEAEDKLATSWGKLKAGN
jgi:hypothetical protein